MLKTITLAAVSLAVAGALSFAAPVPAEAGLFCTKTAHGYAAKKPRFQKWCDSRSERTAKRTTRRAK